MKRKSSGLFKTAMRKFQAALMEKEIRDANNADESNVVTLEPDRAEDTDAQVSDMSGL